MQTQCWVKPLAVEEMNILKSLHYKQAKIGTDSLFADKHSADKFIRPSYGGRKKGGDAAVICCMSFQYLLIVFQGAVLEESIQSQVILKVTSKEILSPAPRD